MRPVLVHSPITSLPLAVGADPLVCIIGGKSPHSLGQKAIVLAGAGAGAGAGASASASACAAAVTGLIAGEEVNVKQTISATS